MLPHATAYATSTPRGREYLVFIYAGRHGFSSATRAGEPVVQTFACGFSGLGPTTDMSRASCGRLRRCGKFFEGLPAA